MAIIHVRIDDRLIHGQVATMWTNNLDASRIMVVDDEAANSEVTKMSLKLATPNGVSLSVLPVKRASERIKEGNYNGQRVFMIIKSPETLMRLIGEGVDLKTVNVGNLTFTEGKKKVSNTVAVSQHDIEVFKKLDEQGIQFTMQLIPSNPSEKFMALINKL